MNMKDLRDFVKNNKNIPDDLEVSISVPLAFSCDEEQLSERFPEERHLHCPTHYQSIRSDGISFYCMHGCSTYDKYIPPDKLDWSPDIYNVSKKGSCTTFESSSTGEIVCDDPLIFEKDDPLYCIEIRCNEEDAHEVFRGEDCDNPSEFCMGCGELEIDCGCDEFCL